MVGAGGVGVLEAAARLLGLSGRTARVEGGGGGEEEEEEANGDDDDDDDDDDDAEFFDETMSLDSSLSSEGKEGFDAALVRTTRCWSTRGLRGPRGDRKGGAAQRGCGLDAAVATPAEASIFFLEKKQIEKRF